MMINKISELNPLNNVQGTKKTEATVKRSADSDSISISDEARVKAEEYYLSKVADETPDVRADRVAEIKAKIKDPSYLSDAVIQSAAEGVLASFGL